MVERMHNDAECEKPKWFIRLIARPLATQTVLTVLFTVAISATVNILTGIPGRSMTRHELDGLLLIAAYMFVCAFFLIRLETRVLPVRRAPNFDEFRAALQHISQEVVWNLVCGIGFLVFGILAGCRYCALYLKISN